METIKEFSYSAPITNKGGSTIPPGEIDFYEIGTDTISHAADGNYPVLIRDVDFTPNAKGVQFTPGDAFGALPPGVHFFAVRAHTIYKTVSEWAPEASVVIDAPTPNAPTNFSIV